MFSLLLISFVLATILTIILIIISLVIYNESMKSFKERSKQINKQENILKDGFSKKKIEELGQFDVIIIGSGIGGLTTAALLSRIGKKVLVLEQHDIIGGCTHTFTEKGFEFDTGVHYLGREVTSSKSISGYFFHLLGLGNIKWSKMDKVYDRAAISPILSKQNTITEKKITSVKQVDFTDNLEETKQNIKKVFPGEENVVESYFRLAQWSSLAFPVYIFLQFLPNWLSKIGERLFHPFLSTFFEKTTRQVLMGLTRNEDLIGVLTYLWGDYGLPPDRSAFVMTGLLIDHFSKGAYYPTGGSSVFAESFLPTILANGGRALVRAPVSRIILSPNGDKALGVTVKDIDIYAPIIISACGVLRTFTELIPSSQTCSHADKVRKHFFLSSPDKNKKREDLDVTELCKSTQLPPPDMVAPSLSMFSLYVGLNGSPKELNIPARNLWLFADWNHDNMTKENLSSSREVTLSICKGETNNLVPFLPMAFIGSASAKDNKWTERYPDKCVLEVLTAADFSSYWEATRLERNSKPKHRGEIYNQMKKQTEDKLLEIIYEQYPQLQGKVSFIDSGTPLTNNFYIGTLNGEVYGLEHSVTRFTKCKWFLKSKTPISGLYLSGQDILVDGVVGALMGGVLCAITINPFKVLYDLIASYIIDEL